MFTAGWCGGMSVAGWLLMALMWGGFLAVVVWAVLRLFPAGRRDPREPLPPGGDPDGELDRRLASGEIDVDDYLRLRDTLTGAR
jgi:putative membrane protein